MERVLYNGFASSTDSDGIRFFYVNPLERRADHFEKDDPGRRREWFNCACCPPNIMCTMASLQHYLATISGDTLYVQQFAGATLSAPVAGGVLSVEVDTDYPWAGAVELRVTSAPPEACGLAVRVPAWSAVPEIRLNENLTEAEAEHGYLLVRRHWRPGEVLRFELDTSPRLTYPDRRVEAVQGTAAIERGPLVYCLEQADQPSGIDLADLALVPGQLEDTRATLPGVGDTILVRAGAVHRAAPQEAGLPYHTAADEAQASGNPGGEQVTATAIPYFQWDNRDGRPMQVWIPAAAPRA
jgi:DUF1680 family protein